MTEEGTAAPGDQVSGGEIKTAGGNGDGGSGNCGHMGADGRKLKEWLVPA